MSQEKAVSEKEGVKAGSVKKEGAGPVPAALKSGKAKKRTDTKAAARTKPAGKKGAAGQPGAQKEAAFLKDASALGLRDPRLYINREISWIEFDRKVLETAMDKRVPLLDRVKFLAIFFNNLDEFYMVRVMNLQRQARSGVAPTGADQMPPARQLSEIRRRVQEMLDAAEVLWFDELKPALAKKDIRFVKYEDLTGRQKTRVNRYFDEQIFPILTPQAVDAGRPFPMISNTSINIVAELEAVAASAPVKVRFARVKCPNNLPRFLFLTDADKEGSETFAVTEDTNQVLLVEDLIVRRMGQLFPGYKVKNSGLFRVTRNTDGEIEEDEADDLLSAVRDYVEQRRFGSVVRLELGRGMPKRLQ